MWELVARPCLEYEAEVWWTGGRSACKVGFITDKNGQEIVEVKQYSRSGGEGSRVKKAGGRDEGDV